MNIQTLGADLKRHWPFYLIWIVALSFAWHWRRWNDLPPTGYALIVFSLLAAIMSFDERMKWWRKGIWILIIGLFLFIESRAIRKDNKDNADRLGNLVAEQEALVKKEQSLVDSMVALNTKIDKNAKYAAAHDYPAVLHYHAQIRAELDEVHILATDRQRLHQFAIDELKNGPSFRIPIARAPNEEVRTALQNQWEAQLKQTEDDYLAQFHKDLETRLIKLEREVLSETSAPKTTDLTDEALIKTYSLDNPYAAPGAIATMEKRAAAMVP